eukprot:CAMPEP_0179458778 /NCGR_PEP_ID=MMETSP0799-20121207/42248_1 /TAXON_ID=46947 /ORGANISM="Geminigera cryophila, Strain CCMP2564" /LENGTH=242 /DNA_ID=CAMNT_0021260209 /DNA_START=395 /DNA_END=1126 /DNA_ORIENTATION=+
MAFQVLPRNPVVLQSCGPTCRSPVSPLRCSKAGGEAQMQLKGRVEEGKRRLLKAVAKGTQNDVLSAARELELISPAGDAARSLVGGEWSLVFSTQTDNTLGGPGAEEDVINAINASLYRFFFKFAPFLAGGQDRQKSRTGAITSNIQQVDIDTKRVDNRVLVQLWQGGPKVKIRVVGDLIGNDPLDLGVTFTSFFIGAPPLPTVELPLPRPLGRLRTTFCDEEMRLSRGGRGGIFVLKKIPS